MTTREFQLKDGSSDKFWRITLDGKSYTVNFGRTGTQGQTQTKELASDDEARKTYEKLVAEKLKKGYAETTSGATTAAPKVAPKAPPAVRTTPPAVVVSSPANVAEPPTVTPPARKTGGLESRVELEPIEWRFATWRKVTVPPPPAPGPFDRPGCAARLRKLRFVQYGWQPDWSNVGLPPSMSREEAHYWLLAMAGLEKDVDLDALAARLDNAKLDGTVSAADVREILSGPNARFLDHNLMLVARHLIDAEALGGFLLEADLMGKSHEYRTGGLSGFRAHVLPYLSERQAEDLRQKLRPFIKPSAWPASLYDPTPHFQLAAALGMHDELLPVIESWADEMYTKEGWSDHYHQPQLVIYGLSSPALVQHHVRRLRLRCKTPLHLVGWLAHTETSALDWVSDSILAVTNKEEAETLTRVFCLVQADVGGFWEAAGTPMCRDAAHGPPEIAHPAPRLRRPRGCIGEADLWSGSLGRRPKRACRQRRSGNRRRKRYTASWGCCGCRRAQTARCRAIRRP
jgi:predicted DNA-binding WGR domain protein